MPESKFNLWNRETILDRINAFPCIKLFLSGHHHDGCAEQCNGVHHITFKGMVETKTENAFAIVEVHSDRIELTGFDREPSRTLPIQ